MTKVAFKKIYITYRLYIFPVVIIFSCLILIVLIIYPQTSQLIQNYQTENQLKSKFQIMEAKAQVLEKVDGEDIKNKLKLAMSSYPSEHEYPDVVGIIQNIVSRYGFTMTSLHLGGSSETSKTTTSDFSVKLELVGPKTMINSLINSLENAPRIMKVAGIEVSSPRSNDIVETVLTLAVYFKPLPNDFGNADSPLPTLSERDEVILATLTRAPASSQSAFLVPKGKPNPFE